MIAANNMIGVIGHLIILAAALAGSAGQIKVQPFWHDWSTWRLTIGLVVIGVAVSIIWIKFGRQKIRRAMLSLRRPLLGYARHPFKLLGALITSMGLTMCNVLCLAACTHALQTPLPFVTILLIFSLGIGAGTVTPTPGGLGGFEAGLFAGFVAYGVSAPSALALALLYRLISYWLPLILGGLAFLAAQRQHLFST